MTAHLRNYEVTVLGERKQVRTVALAATTAPTAWLTLYRIPVAEVRDAYDLGFPGFPGNQPATGHGETEGEVWVRFTPKPGLRSEPWTLTIRRGELAGQEALL